MLSTRRLETQLSIPTNANDRLLKEAATYLNISIEKLQKLTVYRMTVPTDTSSEILEEVFVDPILDISHWSDGIIPQDTEPMWTVEIQYRPGVTDNIARSAEEALGLMGLKKSIVSTGTLWLLYGDCSRNEVQKFALELLANDLIQKIDVRSIEETIQWNRFDDVRLPIVKLEPMQELFKTYDIQASLNQWMEWSKVNCWALNEEEIRHLLAHFSSTDVRITRAENGLPELPTDVEIEVVAQSWSEHCKHKIFAANIDYTESIEDDSWLKLGNHQVDSLFKTYIRAATQKIEEEREITWLRSVFHDNAGVVDFDDAVDVSIKVETHNSPSALDPYGGAITGILGVNRDILGVGLGAKPIGNMDVFCFADPSWPLEGDESSMPLGLLAPRRLLEGVHKGVEDGGNMSGIPTINGAIFFDQDYAGKPLVFVGTVGVMPKTTPDGRDSVIKEIQVGDRIVMVGGAIGADGIHGATFSSLELNEDSPATAVQIGDAITQKRTMDFLLEARDLGLFTCVTDNGAGGLSSSVGEMATLCNGAHMDLSKAHTKYPNLKPWELMISESQERMTFAVSPKDMSALLDLADRRGVVARDLGEFTDSGALIVSYAGELVAHLDLEFLHESLPQMQLKAHWDGSRKRRSWIHRDDRQSIESVSLENQLSTLLSTPNVVSKEPWVRQYDHEVQASTAVKPFGGQTQEGPNDSGVLWLKPHGGALESAISVGCGLAPRMSLLDPYVMAQYAVDEAIRNIVSTGADIDQTCALDNFCWPDPVQSEKTPDGEYKLGQLVRCCRGLFDICMAYGIPLVSGKDSMKNDFRGRNGRDEPLTISILPTLLVTAMGKSTIGRSQTSDFKKVGDRILRIGVRGSGLAGSEFSEQFRVVEKDNQVSPVSIERNVILYRQIRDLLEAGLLSSVHDISDGGVLTSIIESCFGNTMAVNVVFSSMDSVTLFNEGPGQFIVSITPENIAEVLSILNETEVDELGDVISSTHSIVNGIAINMTTLHSAWTREL